jgi:hypothetical protein
MSVPRELSQLEVSLLPQLEPVRGADADLPTVDEAQLARRWLGSLTMRIEVEEASPDIVASIELVRHQVYRVGALAAFSDGAKTCDQRFSELLDAVDDKGLIGRPSLSRRPSSSMLLSVDPSAPVSPLLDLHDARSEAEASYTTLVALAKPVEDDDRVAGRLDRLQQTWAELAQLVDGPSRPLTPSLIPQLQRSASQVNLASVLASPDVVPWVPSTSRVPIPAKTPSRPASGRFSLVSNASSGSRPASGASVPSVDHPTSVTSSHSSRQQTLGVGRPPSLGPPRATQQRASSSRRTSGLQRVSSSQSLGSVRKPSKYRANPKRQLDIEVGRIVNALPVRSTLFARTPS